MIAAFNSVGQKLVFVWCISLSLLAGCTSHSGETRYSRPAYVYPAAGPVANWEVRCDFDRVLIPEQGFKQFYDADGRQLSKQEFCASIQR